MTAVGGTATAMKGAVSLAISHGSSIDVWDSETKHVRGSFAPHGMSTPVEAFVWNHNGEVIASSPSKESSDSVVFTSNCIPSDGFHHDPSGKGVVGALAFGGKSRYLLCGDKTTGIISLWDLKKKARARSYKHRSSCLQVEMTDTHVLSLSPDWLMLFDLRQTKLLHLLGRASNFQYTCFALAGKRLWMGRTDGKLDFLVDWTTKQQPKGTPIEFEDMRAPVIGISMSPTKQLLAVASKDGNVVFLDVGEEDSSKSAVVLHRLSLPSERISSISLGWELVAIGTEKGKVLIYTLWNGLREPVAVLEMEERITGLIFAPHGRSSGPTTGEPEMPPDESSPKATPTSSISSTNKEKIEETISEPKKESPKEAPKPATHSKAHPSETRRKSKPQLTKSQENTAKTTAPKNLKEKKSSDVDLQPPKPGNEAVSTRKKTERPQTRSSNRQPSLKTEKNNNPIVAAKQPQVIARPLSQPQVSTTEEKPRKKAIPSQGPSPDEKPASEPAGAEQAQSDKHNESSSSASIESEKMQSTQHKSSTTKKPLAAVAPQGSHQPDNALQKRARPQESEQRIEEQQLRATNDASTQTEPADSQTPPPRATGPPPPPPNVVVPAVRQAITHTVTAATDILRDDLRLEMRTMYVKLLRQTNRQQRRLDELMEENERLRSDNERLVRQLTENKENRV